MRKYPHIVWPAAIILLLISGAAVTFGILIAAHSDGGAQVVEEYYHKAITFDSLAAVQRSSDELGWSASIEIRRDRTGTVTIQDRLGLPVKNLTGFIRVERPQTVGTLGIFSLGEDPNASGRYIFDFPYTNPGLWDLTIDARRGDENFIRRIRKEL